MGTKRTSPEAILDAAEHAFGTDGYSGARLADISAAVGIRRPSLLYHFKTKDALYNAVILRLFESLRETFTEAFEAGGSFEDRMLRLMSAYLAFLDERPAFAPLVIREILDGHGPGRHLLETRLVPLLDLIEQWLAQAGGGEIPEGVQIRSAIMHLGSNAILHAAAGTLQGSLWGSDGGTLDLARRLLLAEDPA
jgi:AcrR family transcriptional regulator